MPPKERAIDRGTRRGSALVIELGRELRQARVEHGLSQASIGRAVGLSGPAVSRIERGQVRTVSILNLARLLSIVGLDLSARAYQTGTPMRDKAQIALLGHLRTYLPASVSWQTEVPVGSSGDLRAWDAVIRLGDDRIAVEAETRLTDVQAVERRIALKLRDSGMSKAILLLANTRTNRTSIRVFQLSLSASFPVSGADALNSLRAGRLPVGSAVILA
jgi:transcriptional regulator with XRE-family HTH domain